MGKNSDIQWTDHTWNPWQGCHKVSSGCRNCYMERDMKRFDKPADVVRLSAPETFRMPYRLPREPAKVFVCSWSDFFIEEADEWRPAAWHIIKNCPHLTFQILTKRPERIAQYLPPDWGDGWPNVWLGVTAENQEMADKRFPILLQIPAAFYFISYEPGLGPLVLRPEWIEPELQAFGGNGVKLFPRIGLVICGGESGPDARPIHPNWVRSLRDQCVAAGVPFFFKQWGEFSPVAPVGPGQLWPDSTILLGGDGTYYPRGMTSQTAVPMFRIGKHAAGRLLDGRIWDQMPAQDNSRLKGQE